ncbi:transporter substrate-binding domain-containing protein [Variovorax sp. ZT5P49]|uniref:transporter substrate-binding domain-containing protein n=1 Tax=Variovorax sp. ZT5P49 TaxID=3443733 RepID=UPI003F4517EF
MKVRIAYIEEPPFYWTGPDQVATGADIELADAVLRAIGVSSIEHHLTSFGELLPGVQEGRWDMNVPIFVTPERARQVTFGEPVWAIGDGFLVPHGNPKALTGYKAIASSSDARLGAVVSTVQIDSAKSSGVAEDRIVTFKDQPAAIAALLTGKIDAYVSTTVGSRALAATHKDLEMVANENNAGGRLPVGAFSFNKNNLELVQAVNKQLRAYLGTADHRTRMAKYGIEATEIDGVVASES